MLVVHRRPIHSLANLRRGSLDDESATSGGLVGIDPSPAPLRRPAVGVEVAPVGEDRRIAPMKRQVLGQERDPVVLEVGVAQQVAAVRAGYPRGREAERYDRQQKSQTLHCRDHAVPVMKSAPRDRIVNKTSRLLPVLIALVVPFEVAAKEPTAPRSVSCLDPEGERYLQGLLDRIHQLETQLDAEVEAHLTERAEAERKLQSVSNGLAQQAPPRSTHQSSPPGSRASMRSKRRSSPRSRRHSTRHSGAPPRRGRGRRCRADGRHVCQRPQGGGEPARRCGRRRSRRERRQSRNGGHGSEHGGDTAPTGTRAKTGSGGARSDKGACFARGE